MPGVRLNFFSFDVQIDFLVTKANGLAVVAKGNFFAAQNAAVKVDRFLGIGYRQNQMVE